jgi:zinc protease
VVDAGALHRFELDNGLSIIVLEDHRLPRLTLGVTLRRGAASVDADRAGLAGFTTDLMKRGAGDRDALTLAAAVDEIGSSLHVSAGWDSINTQVWGLTRDLDRLLEILADVVLRPQLSAEEAERTRSESLAAFERAKSDAHYLESFFTARALYSDERAGFPLSGSPETVETLDAASAREFYTQMFVPNNAVFFASGDVDAEELLERVGEAFGAWPAGALADAGPLLPAPTPTERRIFVIDRPEAVQTRITLAHEGIERTNPDRIAASLLNSVIGGSGFSSRLMKTLRADAGLTYGVGSSFRMRREGGRFSVSTFTRVAEVRRVIDLLLAELDRARTEPPTSKELEDMRSLAVGGFALALETSDAVLASLVDLEIHGLPQDSLDTYRARVRATTTADLARLARELLHPERAAIVLVGPADALLPQLEGLGSVVVIDP